MRKSELNGYVYYVTEDGQHFYNSKMRERPIQTNKKRQNRRYIKLNQDTYFFNFLMANAFPEICGELFEDCEIHHIDGNTQNDAATNLVVMSRKDHCRLHNGLIVKYSMDGEKLGEYINSYEAAASIDNKITPSAIRECLCKNSKSSGGYLWKREY